MPPLKVCVVTSTRADYGVLYWVMREIQEEPALSLQILATGTHLSPMHGLTYRNIESDGFTIDAKVEMLLSADTPTGAAKSMGLGVIGVAEALDRLAPDLLLLLGDRYEILSAAQAALILKIPIAHIAGGDTTEGAFDEAIRHSISKMSHIHFVTNAEAADRLHQMGEDPSHIHLVGSPGIDYIVRLELAGREELTRRTGYEFRDRNLLVTFHPATLEAESAAQQIEELLHALEALGDGVGVLFTMPNADPESHQIVDMIVRYVESHPNATAATTLGQRLYLSAMSHFDVVVGNSSSGLGETPSFKKPTVNIGDRQFGRIMASSVISCACERGAIRDAIERAFELDCSEAVNPYGDGTASVKIRAVLAALGDPRQLLRKRFFVPEPLLQRNRETPGR